MTDTFRALCAELTYCWSRTTNPDDFAENAAPVIGRMRAALAQLEKECDHPITPSLELAQQWLGAPIAPGELSLEIFTRAAQWGADQELEATLAEVSFLNSRALADRVRAARRPKPTSLKEQALELAKPAGTEGAYVTFGPEELALIRRALEALPDD